VVEGWEKGGRGRGMERRRAGPRVGKKLGVVEGLEGGGWLIRNGRRWVW